MSDGFAHRAEIELTYADSDARPSAPSAGPSDEHAARLVATLLAQDVGAIGGDRSRTAVGRDGQVVRIDVAAADLTALRAALNTWLSLASVAERVAGRASTWAADRGAA